MNDVIIIGGGLAGLVNALLLGRSGLKVVLIERKRYPFHRVCGEYISDEVLPFLNSLGIFPKEQGAVSIHSLQLSSVQGKDTKLPLEMGGFGLSRYSLDMLLYEKARELGCSFLLDTQAVQVDFSEDSSSFSVGLNSGETLWAKVVIGAYGKRSKLDKDLARPFISSRSPYIGVKYHIETDHPDGCIALHNFKGGYCGISNIEEGKTNLCYLSHRDNLRKYGSIPEMESTLLYENPFLKKIFHEATFLFQKPLVINEVSFAPKNPVERHLLMCGDAAGMITPLCGNGMAMAIHGAKLLSEQIIRFFHEPDFSRQDLEKSYAQIWKSMFSKRLWAGRKIQALFGSRWLSSMAVNLAKTSQNTAKFLIDKTHGTVF